MPLPMVHLAVARLAAEKLQIKELSDYYLGSIAPDGIHMLEGWTPEDKNASHLGIRSGNWEPKLVLDLLKLLPEFENRDYLLGYAMHLLTDAYWNKAFMPDFHARYSADPAPKQEFKPAYYFDTDRLDLMLYNTLPERAEIWSELKKAKAADIPGVLPAKAAELWRERTLPWYDNLGDLSEPVRYIKAQELLDFIPRAAEFCAEYIKENR